MLRPRIHAPMPEKPCSAWSLSTPVSPPSPPPCMALNIRVGKTHSMSSGPRTPRGCSRLWSGPALKPSSETEKLATRSFGMALLPGAGLTRQSNHGDRGAGKGRVVPLVWRGGGRGAPEARGRAALDPDALPPPRAPGAAGDLARLHGPSGAHGRAAGGR